MKLELLMTKPRLTKSILKQIPWTTDISKIKHGTGMGYIVSQFKTRRVILFKFEDKYYLTYGKSLMSNDRVYVVAGSRGTHVEIKSDISARWHAAHQSLIKRSGRQIFI